MDTKQHEKLLYKELSYQIQGAAIEVRKNFGSIAKFSCVLVFLLMFFGVFASSTQAAQISFETRATQVQIGEKFEVKLFADAEQESVNAFEGKITFPSNFVKAREIRDGNSIINFWIEKPHEEQGTRDKEQGTEDRGQGARDREQGKITFSGITPGGFQSNNGLLFSVIFEAKSEGLARFEISDARVLRNDGTGSAAALRAAPLEITISSEAPAAAATITKIKDTEPPESFVPEIAKDETLFEGKWFVVFATQDKASGIDHYEIKELRQRILSIFVKWVPAESPYVLTDQELRSFVWIKAVDKAGNERIAKIAPRNPLAWYENYENWIIIIGGITLFITFIWYLWRRNPKH